MLLELRDLSVGIEGKKVLHGINLEVSSGEVLVILGPNGTGKTTLLRAIAGVGNLEISGKILFQDKDITNESPEERFKLGIMLSNQDPPVIPLRLRDLIYAIYNKANDRDLDELPPEEFRKKLKDAMRRLSIKESLLDRMAFKGFSGGEKKKTEFLMSYLFGKKVILLDEPDSGVDLDSLIEMAKMIQEMKESGRSIVLVSHNAHFIDYVKPDRAILLREGKIVAEARGNEIFDLIKNGYQ